MDVPPGTSSLSRAGEWGHSPQKNMRYVKRRILRHADLELVLAHHLSSGLLRRPICGIRSGNRFLGSNIGQHVLSTII